MSTTNEQMIRLANLLDGLSAIRVSDGDFDSRYWYKCLIGQAAKNGIDGWSIYHVNDTVKVYNNSFSRDCTPDNMVIRLYGHDAYQSIFTKHAYTFGAALTTLYGFIVMNGGFPEREKPAASGMAERYAKLAEAVKYVEALREHGLMVTINESDLNSIQIKVALS